MLWRSHSPSSGMSLPLTLLLKSDTRSSWAGLFGIPAKRQKSAISCYTRKIQKTLLRKREMACMYLSIFESGEKVAAEGQTIDPASLYSAFAQVADGRKKKGKRYPLP